jgi:gamma-glutamyltranspeptidase/glutathione hydrolase
MSIGAAGGPTIITQVLLGLIHSLDHGLSPPEALRQPRFHHQWSPDRVRLEQAAGDALVEDLRSRGHDVVVEKEFGACQIIRRHRGEPFDGASDPRVSGMAAESSP